MKYLLDIETHLQMSDMIISKYIPTNVLTGARFIPTLRYPISGMSGSDIEKQEIEKYTSKNKLQDVLSPIPYLAYKSSRMMKELLVNLIYLDCDYTILSDLKFNKLLKSSTCIHDPEETYDSVVFSYIENITEEDFRRLETLILHIYHTQIKPIVGFKTRNVWDIDLETNNIWLVDIGNVYEYRFKEALENLK